MVVLFAYSGSFWMVCQSSAHSRSVRWMPSMIQRERARVRDIDIVQRDPQQAGRKLRA